MNNLRTYIASDSNIRPIVISEIERLGNHANLNHIDVSQVKNMHGLFADHTFNGDISMWDVSNVVDMSGMFLGSSFNGDISKWNVSSVINMDWMFRHSQFNGNLSKWMVSNVETMNFIFYKSKFTNNISDWKLHNDIKIDIDLLRIIENSHIIQSSQEAAFLKNNIFQISIGKTASL